MIIPIIIGGSLAVAGIINLIIGCKKIKINNRIKLDNQKLEEENSYNLFSKLEMPLVKVLADMEITGIRVDKETLKKQIGKITCQCQY